MSEHDPTTPDGHDDRSGVAGRVASLLGRARFAIGTALRRRGSLAVFAAVTIVYTVGYLYAINHLTLDGSGFRVVTLSSDVIVERFFEVRGPYNYEPIALVELGPVTYQFALNTFIGLGIAALVGINLAITYLAWRQPAACGLGTSSAGLLAGVPALLSGSACCGPVVLLALGIQATGTLITAFEILLPAAVVMRLGSLLLVARRIDPALVAGSGSAS